MTIVLSPARQRWLAIGLAVLTAALIVWLFVLPLWRSMALHNEHIAMLRMQAARLEALTAAQPRLEAVAKEVAADKTVRSLTFAAVSPSVGVAELQSTVSRLFAAAGATVTSVEALESDPGSVAVRTSVETDIASLVRALQAIGTSRPLLTVEKLSVSEPDGAFVAIGPQPSVANKLIVEIVVSARLRGA
jgi:Tfp pilus assembly protein PilN